MKYSIILVLSIFFIFTIQSCLEECERINDPICMEVPPTDEICQVAFERWFYVEANDKCKKIGYSGCSQLGFASEEDCANCVCN